MTYFGFLLQFVVLPIVILLGWAWWDSRRGKQLPTALQSWPVWSVVLLHCLIALVYTTPWDNYLVATGVWWYDENLVTGITFGWVPIEEYTFFVLQPIFSGLLLVTLLRYLTPAQPPQAIRGLRPVMFTILGGLWLFAAGVLIAGWRPATYLGLELIWALPPIMFQVAFGADILWRQRRVVGLTLMLTTAYLAGADALAISAGTWTINPEQSFHNILIGGILPLEELIFFFLTNVLLVFGVTLILSRASHERFRTFIQCWQRGRHVDLAV